MYVQHSNSSQHSVTAEFAARAVKPGGGEGGGARGTLASQFLTFTRRHFAWIIGCFAASHASPPPPPPPLVGVLLVGVLLGGMLLVGVLLSIVLVGILMIVVTVVGLAKKERKNVNLYLAL